MTTQFQQTTDMQPHHVDQSQQTQTITLIGTGKKKEKVLLPCSHCKDSFRTECQLQVRISCFERECISNKKTNCYIL